MEYYNIDIDTTHTLGGVFMTALTIFGVLLSIHLKRAKIFRFKLMIIYIIPAIIAVTYFSPAPHMSHSYRTLLVCTFIALLQILYYREVKSDTTEIGYNKSAFPDFLDIAPDMIWTKDLDNRFTYTNEAVREGLLKCSEGEAFGKTGVELAASQRLKGHEYTFGEICSDTDVETLKRNKACRFLEFGTVNGKFLALQVFKAPMYKNDHEDNKILIGTIGMGRDLTYDFVDHERISLLIEEGDIEAVSEAFEIHKRRYMFTGVDIVNGKDKSVVPNGIHSRRWYDKHLDEL